MKNLLLVVLTLSMTACGWLGIRDRSDDYLRATEIAPIEVPESMDARAVGTLYEIPPVAISEVDFEEFEAPRPLPVSENTFTQVVKIQSLGGKRWIMINVSPAEIWPRLRNTLSSSSIPLTVADGQAGVIETQWLRFRDDDTTSHRYRMTVEPGVQQNSSEIRVLHNSAPVDQEAGVEWSATSSSDEREDEFVRLMANSLASIEETGVVSLLAANIGGGEKVTVLTPADEQPTLRMKIEAERAWASLLAAADRGGFSLIDQNRSAGELLVNYSAESEEKKGFFRRLFSGSDDDKKLFPTHKVRFIEATGHIDVQIFDAEGQPLRSSEALSLVKILRSNLS